MYGNDLLAAAVAVSVLLLLCLIGGVAEIAIAIGRRKRSNKRGNNKRGNNKRVKKRRH